jgi:fructuronate reductase
MRIRRIVHLGIGAFHRAHQALYTQDAETIDDIWRITGVSLRSAEVRDRLAPQDWLYTVTERSNGTAATRLVTVIDTVLVAREDPGAVIAALADAETHVVTLTVTEKGYYRHPTTGTLRMDDPAIAADLRGDIPQTIYGYLAAALRQRRTSGLPGWTLLSCDNLSSNGTLLMRLLLEFVEQLDFVLARWVRDHVKAPNTMVDRIVPATSGADRVRVADAIGLDDAAALVTEPFHQWVIENHFAGPRPRWEVAGAQIVRDVAPFELAKLRLLNAAHSTLAYVGLQLGHTYVHEAIADPDLHAFVVAQLRKEAVPSLVQAEGLDPEAYIAAILDRFANAELHHRLDQIAMDGSQKLSQRWLATVEERLALGKGSPLHLTSLAAWVTYTADAPAIASDPLQELYAVIWAEAGRDSRQVVARFADELKLFGPALCASPVALAALADKIEAWRSGDPRQLLKALAEEHAV